MNGITDVFKHKKWVFAYAMSGLGFMYIPPADISNYMIVIIGFTLGASSFDKSQWRKE